MIRSLAALLVALNFAGCAKKMTPTFVMPVTPHSVADSDRRPRRAGEPDWVVPTPDPLPEVPEGTAAELLKQGDEAANAGDMINAVAWWRWGYVKLLPEIRGLPFRHPVSARFMVREKLAERMLFEVDKEWPEDIMRANEIAGAEFGFWAADLSLTRLLTDLYTEEVAGFYDPDTKDLYLIREVPSENPGLQALDALWTLVTGGHKEQKMILAHEVQHALADQHFDLYSLHESYKVDEDASMALSGVIEGEATVMMMLAIMTPREQGDLLSSPPELMTRIMEFLTPLLAGFAGGKTFREAPAIYRDTLLVPYTRGMTFVLHVLQNRGWAGLDAAFARPPQSTEQLLHPHKYIQGLDPPLAVTFPAEPPANLKDWTLVKENTLGELSIRVLLSDTVSKSTANEAAKGWGGDRYRVYEKDGTIRLIWVTEWDSEEDAEQFYEALHTRFLAGRNDPVERRGRRVVIAPGVLDWALAATVAEKNIPIVKKSAKAPFPDVPDPKLAPVSGPGLPIPTEPAGVRGLFEALGVVNTEAVKRGEELADAVCACEDGPCLARALQAQEVWWDEARQKVNNPLDLDRINRAAERMVQCVKRLSVSIPAEHERRRQR